MEITSWSGLEIATDMLANATNVLSLATKNSGLGTKMATCFSMLMTNNGHFLKYCAPLKQLHEKTFA